MTLTSGERMLSAWMAENAFVAWSRFHAPWEVEEVLSAICLPLGVLPKLECTRTADMERVRVTWKAFALGLRNAKINSVIWTDLSDSFGEESFVKRALSVPAPIER